MLSRVHFSAWGLYRTPPIDPPLANGTASCWACVFLTHHPVSVAIEHASVSVSMLLEKRINPCKPSSFHTAIGAWGFGQNRRPRAATNPPRKRHEGPWVWPADHLHQCTLARMNPHSTPGCRWQPVVSQGGDMRPAQGALAPPECPGMGTWR